MKKLLLIVLVSAFLIFTGCRGKNINGEYVEGEYIPVEAVVTTVKSADKLKITTKNGNSKLINISKLNIDKDIQAGTKIKVWLFDAENDVSYVDEEVGDYPDKIEIISR